MADELRDELLEHIWTLGEQGKEADKELLRREVGGGPIDDALERMDKAGFVTFPGDIVSLSTSGREAAEVVVRCHRLAERLLSDVLEIRQEAIESNACRFEHYLSNEVTRSICILMGHPKTCPHGRPIPPGECCVGAVSEMQPLVVPMTEMESGSSGLIRYITTTHHQRLDRLGSLGVVPGAMIHLHQKRPSFVVQLDETQLALDSNIAEDIYVRVVEQVGAGTRRGRGRRFRNGRDKKSNT